MRSNVFVLQSILNNGSVTPSNQVVLVKPKRFVHFAMFHRRCLVHNGSGSATSVSVEDMGRCCDLGKGMTRPARLCRNSSTCIDSQSRQVHVVSKPRGAERLRTKDVRVPKVQSSILGQSRRAESARTAVQYCMTDVHRCLCPGKQCCSTSKRLLYNDGKLNGHFSTATIEVNGKVGLVYGNCGVSKASDVATMPTIRL